MTRWARREIAWVAGLLEGEGSFSKYAAGKNTTYAIQCKMADEDVVRRLQAVLGVGRVTYVPPSQTGYQAQWALRITRLRHVYAVCVAIHPFMGLRRRRRIEQLLCLMNAERSEAELQRAYVEAGKRSAMLRQMRRGE